MTAAAPGGGRGLVARSTLRARIPGTAAVVGMRIGLGAAHDVQAGEGLLQLHRGAAPERAHALRPQGARVHAPDRFRAAGQVRAHHVERRRDG